MGQRGGHGRETEQGLSRARFFVRLLPVLLIVVGAIYDYVTPSTFTGVPLLHRRPAGRRPALLAARHGPDRRRDRRSSCSRCTSLRRRSYRHRRRSPSWSPWSPSPCSPVLINRVVRRGSEQPRLRARRSPRPPSAPSCPSPPSGSAGCEIAARYEAAQADAFIGGDLYAVQDTPHGVRLVVGRRTRARGWGRWRPWPCVIGAFREAAEQEATLEAVAQRLERALRAGGHAARRPGRVRGVHHGRARRDPARRRRSYGSSTAATRSRCCCTPTAALTLLEPPEPALPLGMGELGAWPDRAQERRSRPGRRCCSTRTACPRRATRSGVFYDPAARLAGRIFPGPSELLDALVDDVRRHTGGGTTDDMALLAVRRP